ncbi:ribosome maturation factor RimP [Terriglobus saanensis]|uniref:Ribosome maturation factor RimP n=1 Tax=Terriglobus saanensis (strain ATCC BAA-1853 / DSM 23119 / SP1PR4) TaxID=401053 RepID=E8V7H6_TERSS|nr:ribosome maturation factor RimP [Terriglobus saanensis]ADV83950.1 protein of unknown function DUF150 [Terriglobus saanensis SP1PR4]
MALELDKIRDAADRVAASHQLEIVEVSFTGAGKFSALQIFVEKNAEGRAAMLREAETDESKALPRGVPVEALSGVTHQDCAAFATDFGTLLDVEELVPGTTEYTLEVSSPGIERKLFKTADYERFAGSLVTLKTFQAINGTKNFTGRMTFTDGTATLDLAAVKAKGKKKGTKAEAPQTVEIPFNAIEKAQLVAEI